MCRSNLFESNLLTSDLLKSNLFKNTLRKSNLFKKLNNLFKKKKLVHSRHLQDVQKHHRELQNQGKGVISFRRFRRAALRAQFLRNVVESMARGTSAVLHFQVPPDYDFSRSTAENYAIENIEMTIEEQEGGGEAEVVVDGGEVDEDNAEHGRDDLNRPGVGNSFKEVANGAGGTSSSNGPKNSKEDEKNIVNNEFGFFGGPWDHIRRKMDYTYHPHYTKERQEWQDRLITATVRKTENIHRPWLIYSGGALYVSFFEKISLCVDTS